METKYYLKWCDRYVIYNVITGLLTFVKRDDICRFGSGNINQNGGYYLPVFLTLDDAKQGFAGLCRFCHAANIIDNISIEDLTGNSLDPRFEKEWKQHNTIETNKEV